MAKKAPLKDDITGTAPSVPLETATTGGETLPTTVPEADPADRVDPIEVAPVPVRKIVVGRLNRVTLTEARALRGH